MTSYHDVFSGRHAVLPVIHVVSDSQAFENATIAEQAGADGVFLINHSISVDQLISVYCKLRDRMADWWIGLNCLGSSAQEAVLAIPEDVSGLWTDCAEIDESSADQPAAEAILKARNQSGWGGLYFGGVAFKYQRHVTDFVSAARTAAKYMDLVTTSGPGTGRAADPAKIKTMKQAIGEASLAIASGITPDNVVQYLDCADCFLVATGISRSFTELELSLVQKLVNRVRRWRPAAEEA